MDTYQPGWDGISFWIDGGAPALPRSIPSSEEKRAAGCEMSTLREFSSLFLGRLSTDLRQNDGFRKYMTNANFGLQCIVFLLFSCFCFLLKGQVRLPVVISHSQSWMVWGSAMGYTVFPNSKWQLHEKGVHFVGFIASC